ncbi:MAG: N-acetyltransferase [Solirubrobacteraceae bacterium]|nr:N-acetyltransferase [Solirubrobacteraceae bacterium]
MEIRPATVADAAACAALYAPYVRETAITFETEVPTEAEMAQRIATALEKHAWLVLEEDDGRLRGYAYSRQFHARAAYQWACEVSVFLEHDGPRRTGAGRRMYEALLPILAGRGYRTAIAGITLPNEGSMGLHAALGFELVGTYQDIGYKLGAWHDVAWLQATLQQLDDPPPEPR